jgi:predicted transcriptional regulator of viral defense system
VSRELTEMGAAKTHTDRSTVGTAHRSIAAAKRLGWTLDHVGVDMRNLMPLLELPSSHYSPLDPRIGRQGEHDRRWMVITNLGAELVRG